MNLLFLTVHFPNPQEPGAFRPWMEARLMEEIGYKVTVITSGVHYLTGRDIRSKKGLYCEEYIDRLRIIKIWNLTNHRVSSIKRILNYLLFSLLSGVIAIFKTKKISVVFTGSDPFPILLIAYLVSFLKSAKFIIDERDLIPETAIALGILKPGVFTKFIYLLQQFCRKRAKTIITATPGIKNSLIKYGISEKKIRLLYNADVYIYEEINGENNIINLRELTKKKFLIAYAGGLGQINDLITVLDAVHYLKENSDIGIVIIGEGERLNEYKLKCRKERIENVFFLGAMPRKVTRKLLNQVNICLQTLPSDIYFCNTLTSKVFDYISLGKPVVFAGGGDTANLLRKSHLGVVVEPQDSKQLAFAIYKLYRDNSLRKRIEEKCVEWFKKNFSPQRYREILKEAIEG
jgi:glycosyltransferase involved in cell wall biosynthesis